jgi:alkanesulfonate monooxygenase SsuD/methylene tetrahydromethanopterin reductase-like flavin-dependent oxidoreductase (luciferase family)
MSGLRCAVGLPNVGEYGDPRLLVELACRAESSGWDGVFIWDHLAYGEPGWSVADPYISVAAIAANTSRVRVGVLIAALARRRPWKFAREMATLDVLSEGRLIVGVGLGSQPLEEFAAFGEDPDPRRRHELVDEGLDIVCGLWSGQPFSYEGQHYRVAESLFLPSPIQQPRPPIWIGGRWPVRRSFRRAGRFDGVFPTFEGVGHCERPTPEQLNAVVEYTQSHRVDQASSFDVVTEGQSDGQDHELVAPYEEVGLTWWVEKLGWFRGSVDFTRRRIEQGPPVQAIARDEYPKVSTPRPSTHTCCD